MEFKINNDTWEIRKADKDKMKELWNRITKEQQIKTLKHELAHCYIWEYGFYYVDADEETICEIVAKSNDFINNVVDDYTKMLEKE